MTRTDINELLERKLRKLSDEVENLNSACNLDVETAIANELTKRVIAAADQVKAAAVLGLEVAE